MGMTADAATTATVATAAATSSPTTTTTISTTPLENRNFNALLSVNQSKQPLVRHASLPRRKGGGGRAEGDEGGDGGGGVGGVGTGENGIVPSSFCTGGRRKRKTRPNALTSNGGVQQLGGSVDGGGLSSSLSTESLRQQCGRYNDELSDDDFIEVQSTPTGFHKQQQQHQQQQHHQQQQLQQSNRMLHGFVAQVRKQRHNSDENPLAVTEDDDPTSVLNELDAILDSHGGSTQLFSLSADDESPSPTTPTADEAKVEDCLLDLDNYLEELDAHSSSLTVDDTDEQRSISSGRVSPLPHAQTRTLPLERKVSLVERSLFDKSATLDAAAAMQRGHGLRRTIGSAPEQLRLSTAEAEREADQQLWRRQSMRHTDLLIMPDCPHHSTTTPTSPTVSPSSTATSTPPVTPTTPRSPRHEMPPVLDIDATSPSPSPAHTNSTEMLTQEDIFQNLLLQHGGTQEERPRQFGRRASGHPRVLSLRCDAEPANRCIIVGHEQRPRSAPTAGRNGGGGAVAQPMINAHSSMSDASSVRSSHNASPISLALSSSDASSSMTGGSATAVVGHTEGGGLDANGNSQAAPYMGSTVTTTQLESLDAAQSTGGSVSAAAAATAAAASTNASNTAGMNARWPHDYSRTLALLCCTLGLFNICRFAVLTVHYGGNFLLQFLLLSMLFGIPLLWLQMSLGAKIRAGPVCMWKISPICRGIGIALALVQSLMAIYSTSAIAWLLVYLKDSFPTAVDGSSNATATAPLYRWQDTSHPYRASLNSSNINITECAADYYNIVVLQRLQFARHRDGGEIHFRVNDRLAFNMAIVWAIVFLVLFKGLRSFGKLVFPLTLLPLLSLTVITGKFLSIVDLSKLQNVITATDFDDFLINSKTWTAAAQETFFTWGLLGASVIAISSRSYEPIRGRCSKTALRRDALLVVVLTLMGLTLAALLGMCCMQVLAQHEYIYVPGSYEHPESYVAIHSLKSPTLNAQLLSYPPKWVPHYSSFIGETYQRPALLAHRESGYQALRFISELFPAVAVLAADSVSWVWVALTFTTCFVFGLAQLCAMWKPISSALGNSTSSVLLSCVTGLLLSIPFATEMGISLLHYMDLLLGGAWFIPLLWTAQIFGVFLIRGRPYNGDDLVNDLHMTASLSAFLALSWNVLLPIGLITLTVVEYKVSASNQFYYWRGKSYFSYWARKVGGLTQVGLLLLVPVTALVQIYRYMTSGPPDILDRIQLLYRPNGQHRNSMRRMNGRSAGGGGNLGGRRHGAHGGGNLDTNLPSSHEDAPPKYTPPPSYTTATGARLAKIFRQSIRRSVRRLLGETRTRPILSLDTELNQPPDYSTTERSSINATISESLEIGDSVDHTTAVTPVSAITPYTQRSHTLGGGRKNPPWHDFSTYQPASRRPSSAPRSLDGGGFGSRQQQQQHQHNHQRPYTAADVVTVLGCSSSMRIRRSEQSDIPLSRHMDMPDSPNRNSFRSIENLILNAEPLGQSASVAAAAAEAAASAAIPTRSYSASDRERNGETNASVI